MALPSPYVPSRNRGGLRLVCRLTGPPFRAFRVSLSVRRRRLASGAFFRFREFRVRFYANCALRDVTRESPLSPETGQCCLGYEERTLERVPTYAATNKNGPVERHGSPTGQTHRKLKGGGSILKGSKAAHRRFDVTITVSRARLFINYPGE